jgi:hypothetical protein
MARDGAKRRLTNICFETFKIMSSSEIFFPSQTRKKHSYRRRINAVVALCNLVSRVKLEMRESYDGDEKF